VWVCVWVCVFLCACGCMCLCACVCERIGVRVCEWIRGHAHEWVHMCVRECMWVRGNDWVSALCMRVRASACVYLCVWVSIHVSSHATCTITLQHVPSLCNTLQHVPSLRLKYALTCMCVVQIWRRQWHISVSEYTCDMSTHIVDILYTCIHSLWIHMLQVYRRAAVHMSHVSHSRHLIHVYSLTPSTYITRLLTHFCLLNLSTSSCAHVICLLWGGYD